MLNKNIIMKHFSQASTEYDKYANVQKKMAVKLSAMLNDRHSFENILEIGCGTGCLTKIIAQQFPTAHILATDISESMLKTAKDNLSLYPNIQFKVMDGENIHTNDKYDLIISNAAFQWFSDYNKAFKGFYSCLKKRGILIYATFGKNTFVELHKSFAYAYDKNNFSGYPNNHQFISIQNLTELCKHNKFESTFKTADYIEYFKTVRDFLKSVKKIGANNASSHSCFIRKKIMLNMLSYYQKNFCYNNKIYATYNVIYGINKKI
ncbi:malonyl-ACP O-methyltransferase BioC [Pectinatus sottacetonis]|uniref:malonyl-ACP O-methyltransferase BioC n=1 Tax=Pectinatus sottacetonis TaxID=1002795 RepID=UPI0018C4B7FC|nr:malonyl-ACP O-methyltransferase BioC [Pectinatus sottacetonis]